MSLIFSASLKKLKWELVGYSSALLLWQQGERWPSGRASRAVA